VALLLFPAGGVVGVGLGAGVWLGGVVGVGVCAGGVVGGVGCGLGVGGGVASGSGVVGICLNLTVTSVSLFSWILKPTLSMLRIYPLGTAV